MEESELKKLRIPETVLKKRKISDRLKIRHARATVENQQSNRRRAKKTDGKRFKRAERFIQQYRVKERDEVRLVRQAKTISKTEDTSLQRPIFVVRIRGVNALHPKLAKVLEMLQLKNVNCGSFQYNNKTTKALLKIVEPYVTWGFPSLKTIRDVVYKRAFCRDGDKKVPLTDNNFIEQKLGHVGLVCVEDLIHELYTLGTNFKSVCNFLWPIQLSAPSTGWKKKRQRFSVGGDYGCRDERINSLLRSMI